MDHTAANTELGSRSAATSFHDLDELLLGPTDLEAMPFEFGCDFASAFEDKHLEVDAPGPGHRTASVLSSSSASLQARPKDTKRSHKRKSESVSASSSSSAHRSLPVLAPPVALGGEQDDLSSLDPQANSSTQIGRWTKKEHELFLEGLRLYGKSWKKISSLVVTRTLVQIRTHAQKYLQKQTKAALKAAAAAAGSSSSSSSSSSKSKKAAAPQTHDSEASTWKHHHNSSVFLPIAFPGSSSSSSSSSSSTLSSSFCAPSSAFSTRKDLAPPSIASMSKLDQLLHDDSHAPNSHEDYYSSPTGSDDDLVQWLQHRHLPYLTSSSSPAAKRRRTDTTSSNAWAMVNPMEAIASHASYYSSHSHHSTEYLPSASAFSSGSSAVAHHDSEFGFGHSWL